MGWAPTCSPQRGTPKGALGLAGGQLEHPCWCAWRHSGTARRGQATPAEYSARGVPSKLPRHAPNLTRSRTSETGQKWEGFDAAEHSGDVGRTPVRDCGLAEGFHLGRACAGAYRGEGEHDGGLGTENGPLTRPAASGGARPAMAPRRLFLLRSWAENERERGGQYGASGGAGWRPDRDKPIGRAARPRRRRTAATWLAPGGARRARPRAREGRGGEARPRGWMGRKGGGLAQQRQPPFPFFWISFLQ